MLQPNNIDTKSGKCVLDVLREKHRPPGVANHDVFLTYSELPLLIYVDITPSHVEQLARCLRGSDGPGETDFYHWQCFLLHYGAHSFCLREAVADLALYLANGVVNWMSIRALMANKLIALDKCPGVHPIGVGECLRRVFLVVVMGLVTGWEAQSASF